MKDRISEAEALFKEGYNCSQSLFAAFGDLYGIDRDTALRLSASFGGGLGRMREVCGAVSGMAMIAGLETGTADGSDTEGKKHNYEMVRQLTGEFKEQNGSFICRELLGLNNEVQDAAPAKRNEEYYKKRPCVELVKDAAEITAHFLYEVSFLPVETECQMAQIAILAKEIWHGRYDSIIGKDQTDYMLDKFQSTEAIKEQIEKEGYGYYMLINHAGLAGYFSIHRNPEDLFLSKIYIAEKYRGRNYARKVMNHLEQQCREDGLNKIWLTVNRGNTVSIAVYEKLGFVKARTQTADIGSGYVMDDYIMEKGI